MGRKAVYFSAGLAGGRLLAGLMLLGLLLMVPGPSRRARRPLSRGGAGSAAGRLLRLGLCVAELRPLRRQQGAAAAAKSQTLEDRCPMTSGRAVETGAEDRESTRLTSRYPCAHRI